MGRKNETLEGELLWGAAEIARFIGRPARQVYRMIDAGQIPVRKVGARICASKSRLREFFTTEEEQADA